MISRILPIFRTKEGRENRFWKWFQVNEDELFRLESHQDGIFGRLVKELQRVDKGLMFEFGPVEGGKREFVVSAGSSRNVFPAVLSLAKAAPLLSRWIIVTFRPRRQDFTDLQFADVSVSPDDVRVAFDPRTFDVMMFLGERDLDEQIRGQIGFLLLDHALGEFDVASYLGKIAFKPKVAAVQQSTISLTELVKQFDNAKPAVN